MKKNKSVPNLKAFKQSSSCTQDTNTGSVFKNIFGLKTKEVRSAIITLDESLQKGNNIPTKIRSTKNLNKVMSEPSGDFLEEDNKHQSIFKKLSLRLSGSKKDKQNSTSRNKFDIIRVIKTSSNLSLNNSESFQENKEQICHNYEASETSPNLSGFVRQRKAQMSMRKAFGIFEGFESPADNSISQVKGGNDDDYIKQLHKLFTKDDGRFEADEDMIIKSNECFQDSVTKTFLANETKQNFESSADMFEKHGEPEAQSCNHKSCTYLLNNTANFEQNSTLEPDLYANQLREQARKLSFSKSSGMVFTKQLSNKTSFNRLAGLDDCYGKKQDENNFHKIRPQMNIQNKDRDSAQFNLKSHQDELAHFSHRHLQMVNASVAKENCCGFQDNQLLAHDYEGHSSAVNDFRIQDKTKHNYNEIADVFQTTRESKNFSTESTSGFTDMIYANQDPVDDYKSQQQAREKIPDQKLLVSDKKLAPIKSTPDANTFQFPLQDVNKSCSVSSRGYTNEQHLFSKRRRKRPSSETVREPEEINNAGDSFLLESQNGCDPFESNASPSSINGFNESCMFQNERKLESTSKICKTNKPVNKTNKNMIRRMSVEKRGKSFEETQCEEFALTLAEKLKVIDPQLSNILSAKHKSILDHVPTLTNVCYCPDDTEEFSQISELRTKSHKIPTAEILKTKSKGKHHLETIEQEKNEMENMIVNKIDALYQEKASMERKISENNEFGKEVCSSLTDYLESRQVDKFLTLVQETEKALKLILKLSNMLARIEESYLNLHHNSTDKEKATLHNKMESLKTKIHEAKLIKDSLDKKYEQILSVFHSQLPSSVTKNFDIYLSVKNVLMMDLEELGNEICLAQKQLHSLRSTMTKNSVGTSC